MNNNSPVTELLIESFDQLLDNKHISLKYNTLIQLSILFILFSFYNFNKKDYKKAGVFYLSSFYLFYKFNKKTSNLDIKFITDIIYFFTTLVYLIFIFNDMEFSLNIEFIYMTIIIFSIISFILGYNTKNKYKNKKLKKLNCKMKKLCHLIYLDNNDVKEYHYNKFWKVFDFGTLTFSVFLLLLNNLNKN